MFKKALTIICLFICFLVMINSSAKAQLELEKTPLENVKEINYRITNEHLLDFAAKRNLKYNEIKDVDGVAEKLYNNSFENLSYGQQKKIGNSLLNKFVQDHPLYTGDPMMVKYVASIGKVIGSHLNDKIGALYVFGIVDEPDIKIYTFPGGYIFVTRGYLQAIEDEAQLAASLAREIGAINNHFDLQTIRDNQEAFTLMTSLSKVLNTVENDTGCDLSSEQVQLAKKPFSDPFETLDYFASPTLENLFTNEDYLAKKLLKKVGMIIPPYETILLKDKIALKALERANYDPNSVKELIMTLNKIQPQVQMVNRTINIENWLNEKNINKDNKKQKVEGRYLMMIERFNY
jgi:hypothetical protein